MTDVRNIHNNGNILQAVSANDTDHQLLQSQGRMDTNEPFFVKQLRHNRISRSYFLKRVVDEYCGIYYLQNEFRVNINDLSFEDKKLFLSHVVDIWEYEQYSSSTNNIYAGFIRNFTYMQRLLDEASQETYQEYLETMECSTNLEYEYGISR